MEYHPLPLSSFPITRGIVARRSKVMHLRFLATIHGSDCHAIAEILTLVISPLLATSGGVT